MAESIELTLKKIDAAVALVTSGNNPAASGAISHFPEAYRTISQAIRQDQESTPGGSEESSAKKLNARSSSMRVQRYS